VDILEYNLRREGYAVEKAYDGETGLRMALELKPRLVLLDLMLPGLDGLSVCRALRETDSATPVLLLTAREAEDDKVLGLESGADDYITKPFAMKELLARVRANLRRAAPPAVSAELVSGELRVDTGRRDVTRAGATIELSPKEYELLLYLMTAKGRVVSREELLEKVWAYSFFDDLRVVDVTVRRLREKLEENPAEPVFILTRRGAGYLFGGQ
jgi:two-component system response regulator VicR